MAVVDPQICEAVTDCLKSVSVPSPWDGKSILMAIGIAVTLVWHVVNYRTSKSQRRLDRKWAKYKDEFYSPFWDALNEFEKSVQPSLLPSVLEPMDATEMSAKIGDLSAQMAEIETYCARVSPGEKIEVRFATIFRERSKIIHEKIGRLFANEKPKIAACEEVATEHSNLISELRAELSRVRSVLDK